MLFPCLHRTLLSLALLTPAAGAFGVEVNYWPFFTGQEDPQRKEFTQWQGLGPILFEKETPDHFFAGMRPFFIRRESRDREETSRHFLYPLFNHRKTPRGDRWDLLSLVNYDSFDRDPDVQETRFSLFPLIFFRAHPDPDREYFGIFPIAGEVQDFLGYDRIVWFTFPFSVRMERGGTTTVGMPWPFIRFVHGEDTEGFHLWPLYGRVVEGERAWRQYFLWPLGFETHSELDTEHPSEAHGFIPFYTWSRTPTAESLTVVWPFFGYTVSDSPQYHERRFFWPLLVQRRGEIHYINRWAPLYTHSIRRGVDKRWFLWPLFRREAWIERDLQHEKSQMLYFLYWSLEQSRPEDPDGPRARKRHLWPLFSHWDDGAGRAQFQAFSPFEVFFPYNEIVRENWSPLFAIYRYNRNPEVRRHAFLFDFVTWTRQENKTSFNVGPIAGYERGEAGRRFELLRGFLTIGAPEEGQRSFRFLWLPPERKSEDATEDEHK